MRGAACPGAGAPHVRALGDGAVGLDGALGDSDGHVAEPGMGGMMSRMMGSVRGVRGAEAQTGEAVEH